MDKADGGVVIRYATWAQDRAAIAAVRREVFVLEQCVPESIETDGRDADCWHVLAIEPEGRAIGTGRLLADGHIGRLAVLAPWRRRGIGRRLLEALVQRAAALGFATVMLNSQTHATGFYEAAGFRARGERFMEAGIPHVPMSRRLSAP